MAKTLCIIFGHSGVTKVEQTTFRWCSLTKNFDWTQWINSWNTVFVSVYSVLLLRSFTFNKHFEELICDHFHRELIYNRFVFAFSSVVFLIRLISVSRPCRPFSAFLIFNPNININQVQKNKYKPKNTIVLAQLKHINDPRLFSIKCMACLTNQGNTWVNVM